MVLFPCIFCYCVPGWSCINWQILWFIFYCFIVFNVLFLFSRPVDVCARCWFSRRRTFEGELCPSNIDFRGGVMPLKHWLYGRELSLTKHHQAHERELCRLIAHGREICLTNHCLTGGGQASQTSIYKYIYIYLIALREGVKPPKHLLPYGRGSSLPNIYL